MIEKMNSMLKEIGSKYSTEDGLTFATIIPRTDDILILKRTFKTLEESMQFVQNVYDNYK